MYKKTKELDILLEEFSKLEDNFIGIETGKEYTDEAIEKMNDRMVEIALEIVYDLLNKRY